MTRSSKTWCGRCTEWRRRTRARRFVWWTSATHWRRSCGSRWTERTRLRCRKECSGSMANGNGFDPSRLTLQDWTRMLHNAARVQPGAPDYDEARATVGYALANIGHLNRVQNQADYAAGQQPGIAASPFASAFEG